MKDAVLLLVSFWATWIIVAALLTGGDGFLAALVIAAIAAFPVRLMLGALIDKVQEMRSPKVSRDLPTLPPRDDSNGPTT